MRNEATTSRASYISITSRQDVLAKPKGRYLLSAVLALVAFDCVVSWKQIGPVNNSEIRTQAFVEPAGAKDEVLPEAIRGPGAEL